MSGLRAPFNSNGFLSLENSRFQSWKMTNPLEFPELGSSITFPMFLSMVDSPKKKSAAALSLSLSLSKSRRCVATWPWRSSPAGASLHRWPPLLESDLWFQASVRLCHGLAAKKRLWLLKFRCWKNTSYMMLYDVIWCYMMLDDVRWCYMMLYDVIWCYMMLDDVRWCYMMLYDVIWCYMMLYDVIWCYMILYDLRWC